MNDGPASRSPVGIEPWGRDDLPLLQRCLADPAMMEHLGGPEGPQKIAERQARYEQRASNQFKIVDRASGAGVGWVGFWEREWGGQEVYETGWAVTPPFQGRGFAPAAMRELLDIARTQAQRRFVHAFPAVDNGPSNAICQKLDFELLGAIEIEYPPGRRMRANDWRLDLEAIGRQS
jgi:RimJ/RimL family protein N-acetyltransferase